MKLNLDHPDLEEFEWDSAVRRRKRMNPNRRTKRPGAEPAVPLADPEPDETGFNPTFSSSKHEREWILNYLVHFYEDKLITDVLRQVKGGKEANVYCCRAHPSTGVELIAAKVYRPRMFRQLRNDALYRKGRMVIDDQGKEVKDWRRLHAVKKGTNFGQALAHTSWLAHEYQTLRRLYEAGADVPRPFAIDENAILMAYMGETDSPAPTLNAVPLSRDEARPIFNRLMRNVDLMLAHGRVHADLSAYNVLYWEGDVKIIDFPQAVDPLGNPHAADLLRRDVERLCQYFGRYGVKADPVELAGELWRRHVTSMDVPHEEDFDESTP